MPQPLTTILALPVLNFLPRAHLLPLPLQLPFSVPTTSPLRVTTIVKLAKFSIMRWFKRKSKSEQEEQNNARNLPDNRTPRVPGKIASLPAPLLERIFSFVCPHTQDETYESCEQSALEDTCMLCDLRDLAHCAQVSRTWHQLAANVL